MQKKEKILSKSRKSQVTIFVIIALVLIVAVGGYFVFREKIFPSAIPSEFLPVYNQYLFCIQQTAIDGAKIMGSQGGYINLPAFEAGSTYAPFSNQLDFMGMAVPYWYYISGNGIKKQQWPSKSMMESQLADYIKENGGKNCDFSSFDARGYNITLQDFSNANIRTTIQDNKILLSINQRISIVSEDQSLSITAHTTQIDSGMGRLYDSAKKIFDYEMDKSFLETYSRDVLYTYAPVEGMELNCSPKIWNPSDVFTKLRNSLSANIGLIKINGDSYSIKNTYTDYFVVGKKNNNLKLEGQQASFLYLNNWPARFEVWPTKNNVMSAEPVGNQQGLGSMGFCYTPYKFVYDMYFPVLVQVYNPNNANDIFQFAYSVVISKNEAREAMPAESYSPPAESICDKANQDLVISTYTANLQPIEADIKFKCLNDECSLGRTKLDNSTGIASLNVKAPQCVNGIISAKAEAYQETSKLASTNEETNIYLVMARQKTLNLEVYVDGNKITSDTALLSLTNINEDNLSAASQTISYPSSNQINLAEGEYDFDLKAYKSSSIIIPAMITKQCVNVPKIGIGGLFGMQDEKCADLEIPSQTLSNSLYAGGKIKQYITQSEIENSNTMRVYATSIKLSQTAEDIALGLDEIDAKSIDVQLS